MFCHVRKRPGRGWENKVGWLQRQYLLTNFSDTTDHVELLLLNAMIQKLEEQLILIL